MDSWTKLDGTQRFVVSNKLELLEIYTHDLFVNLLRARNTI